MRQWSHGHHADHAGVAGALENLAKILGEAFVVQVGVVSISSIFRNPKSDIRNKFKIQNPKSEKKTQIQNLNSQCFVSRFGFRDSDLIGFQDSDIGFWDF